jgi:Icc-related predicted phosphoesterase
LKLLLFSDVHADVIACHQLVERSRKVDVVVGAGDFGNVRRDLQRTIDLLRAIDRPAVLVAGNAESSEELLEACRDWPQAHVLHGSGVEINGVRFFGIGGAVPVTPFGSWSYDFTEEQAAELLASCPMGCVLVSHSPPRGAVDRTSQGVSLGSTAIRAAVLRVEPLLVVCGHIHGSAGQQEVVGHTPVVNAGPGGADWELEATPAGGR